MSAHSIAALFGLLLRVAASPATDGGSDEEKAFQAARAQHDRWVQRPSLYQRTAGREALARTGDPRALRILSADYRGAEAPSDRVQALIVSLATERCRRPEQLPIYAEWRSEQSGPEDAWLWYRSLRVAADAGDLEVLDRAIARAPGIWLECAAIQALPAPESLDRIPACEAVIATFDSTTVPLASKRVAARFLARVLGWKGVPEIDADAWRRTLAGSASAT